MMTSPTTSQSIRSYNPNPARLMNEKTKPEPQVPQNNDRIETSLRLAHKHGLDIKRTNIPPEVELPTDIPHLFFYSSQKKQWLIGGQNVSYISPFNTGGLIPDTPPPITFFSISHHNWIPSLTLPQKARDNDLIILSSSAAKGTTINGAHLSPAGTHTINKDERHIFRYSASQAQWNLEQAPKVTTTTTGPVPPITPTEPAPPEPGLNEQQLIKLSGSKTRVTMSAINSPDKLVLPPHAHDRDRVVITSTSNKPVHIDNLNINNPSAMQVEAGDQYEFMYLKKNNKWEVMSAPQSHYSAKQLSDAQVPPLTKPKTIIDVNTKDWGHTLKLPASAVPGSRVIVRSKSEQPFTINASSDHVIRPNEIIAFKADEKGKLNKETVTIDLLLLYSDKARERLGAEKMVSRLTEGLHLTNEALENSGANFRFRSTAIKEVKAHSSWTKLEHPLAALREDPDIQNSRNALKADGIYYEGTENNYAGLAYVKASAHNMVAVGNIEASTIVMRHELGHNMGVKHGGASTSFNQGYTRFKTVMGGNDIPYYSTPHRYTPDGEPLGVANEIDAVRTMNAFSARVAAYR